MNYRFPTEKIAVAAEQWLCDKAAELGMPFTGVSQRWAIPTAERLPLPDEAKMSDIGEPTGFWLFPCVPDDVIERIPEETALEFLNLFQPEIIPTETGV